MTPKQLFWVLFAHAFGSFIWKIYPFTVAFILIMNWPDETSEYLLDGFLIGYPLYVIISQLIYTYSADNKVFYVERHYEFDTEKMHSYLADGSGGSIAISSFIKFVEKKNYYLLFISKAQFYCIPKDCFQSVEDREWFEEVFLMKLKK